MKIVFNGKEEIVPEGATVEGLIFLKGLNPGTVIVEHNYNLAKRESWPDIVLKESDRLEVLRLVGGG